jgi:hypothetical protein
MIENHVPIPITEFGGLFDRGPDEAIPLNHFKIAQNLKFKPSSFRTREGSVLSVQCGAVLQFHVYKITGQASRLLILLAGGNLYDSTNMAGPILSIAAMTDFSMEVFFDRAYITPHNGLTGLPGQWVYYYTGSGVAKLAGGAAVPYSPGMVPSAGPPGNMDDGIHAFACGFETATGYITGFGAFCAFSNPDGKGGKVIHLDNIHIGPPGTVARVLFATKNIADVALGGNWNGDYANQEWFTHPLGRIPDNTTTARDVSFFDADLVDQADYILEQLPTIPAGVGITSYQGSMVVWGEDANQATVRVSKAGEPESFNAIEGFIQVEPSNGGGVRNCVEFRSTLYMFKSQRCYGTQALSDKDAVFWTAPLLDGSVGTECHGVGKIFERNSNTVDKYFIASRRGLLLFTGVFQEDLTWKVGDIWDRITPNYFHKVQVAVDADNLFVYVSLPLDGSTVTNVILFGDYTNGLDSEKIKWSIWTFPHKPVSIGLDVDDVSKKIIFRYAREDQNIYQLEATVHNDYNNAIPTIFETGETPQDSKGEVFHHGGARFRVYGQGNLSLTVTTLDSSVVQTLPSIPLRTTPGEYPFRSYNLQSEKVTLRGTLVNFDEYLTITKIWVFVRQLWLTRPQ